LRGSSRPKPPGPAFGRPDLAAGAVDPGSRLRRVRDDRAC
jgi:hypothetical protein